jgi:hypothetical protein
MASWTSGAARVHGGPSGDAYKTRGGTTPVQGAQAFEVTGDGWGR